MNCLAFERDALALGNFVVEDGSRNLAHSSVVIERSRPTEEYRVDHLSLFFNSLFMALAMSAPYLVLGYVSAASIKEYVSRETLARHLGDKGARPVLNAVGIGVLLPICSCGVIPLGVGVHGAGAARGMSWPQ